jgi:hypothetical protein
MIVATVSRDEGEYRLIEAWVKQASREDIFIDSLFFGRGPTTDDSGK